jgi:hypothetical protein
MTASPERSRREGLSPILIPSARPFRSTSRQIAGTAIAASTSFSRSPRRKGATSRANAVATPRPIDPLDSCANRASQAKPRAKTTISARSVAPNSFGNSETTGPIPGRRRSRHARPVVNPVAWLLARIPGYPCRVLLTFNLPELRVTPMSPPRPLMASSSTP